MSKTAAMAALDRSIKIGVKDLHLQLSGRKGKSGVNGFGDEFDTALGRFQVELSRYYQECFGAALAEIERMGKVASKKKRDK